MIENIIENQYKIYEGVYLVMYKSQLYNLNKIVIDNYTSYVKMYQNEEIIINDFLNHIDYIYDIKNFKWIKEVKNVNK